MNWIPIAAALGVAIIVVVLYRVIVREVGFAQLPAHIRDVLKRIPDIKIHRILAKGTRYQFSGQSQGRPIQIKVRTNGWGESSSIMKIQIQWETRSVYRWLKNKRSIEPSQIPDFVMDAARQAVEAALGSLDSISRSSQAEVQGCRAYDIQGRSHDWLFGIELLDNGDPLELEMIPA